MIGRRVRHYFCRAFLQTRPDSLGERVDSGFPSLCNPALLRCGFLSSQYCRAAHSCTMGEKSPGLAVIRLMGKPRFCDHLPRHWFGNTSVVHGIKRPQHPGPRYTLPPCGNRENMGRWLTWVSHQRLTGWACSQCGWTFPVPALLTDKDAKSAYDRLASSKFQDHDCAVHGPRRCWPTPIVSRPVPESSSLEASSRKMPPRSPCRK